LVLKRPSALRRMFLPPSELGMGESFIFGDYDIEGDMVAAFGLVDRLERPQLSLKKVLTLGWRMWQLERNGRQHDYFDGEFNEYAGEGRLHSQQRDQQAVQFHYDLSNEFYKLWLDERLVYSCAYFASEDESLDRAQERKLDRICRKLNLQPGERFLDIGCGFGGLLIHAVTQYGVEGMGISLSEAQTAEARARIETAGISDRCCIEIKHYEEFDQTPFDKIASVGMFEHVGDKKLPGYFVRANQLLKPGGLFLLQGGSAQLDRRHVGRSWMEWLGLGRNAFMKKYSFPDSRVIDIPTVVKTAEMAGFETRDVESLREHYPLTLRHWLNRLEQNRETAVAEVGEVAFRSWRLILAGYIYLIEKGQLSEYQSLFAKPLADGRVPLPLTRRL
jgi:cyclopropane-fatty-acyl-phospholipid synthase